MTKDDNTEHLSMIVARPERDLYIVQLIEKDLSAQGKTMDQAMRP